MSEMRDLYQRVLLDHYKNPRNFGELEKANRRCEGHNPLCGDRVTLYALVEGQTVKDVSFDGSACAICTASASVMTDLLKGKTIEEVEALYGEFRSIVTGDAPGPPNVPGAEELSVFWGVREYPVRVKCATLPWQTMLAALDNKDQTATTE